ncbi:hypothetical protein [Ruminococcus sp. OA3]|nr:hypothetical protein [Ruminococcus sp. OA3]
MKRRNLWKRWLAGMLSGIMVLGSTGSVFAAEDRILTERQEV